MEGEEGQSPKIARGVSVKRGWFPNIEWVTGEGKSVNSILHYQHQFAQGGGRGLEVSKQLKVVPRTPPERRFLKGIRKRGGQDHFEGRGIEEALV